MATESGDKPSGSYSGGSGASRPKPAGGYVPRTGAPGAGGPNRTGGRPPMGAGGPGGPGMGRGRPPVRRRVCRICMERTGGVDWKAANFLRNFITERGKILSGRSTGTCARCQRQLTEAIKRARNIALIPTSPV